MQTQTKISIFLITIITAFILGRNSVNKTETKVQETTDTHTTITTTKKIDGTITTVEVQDQVSKLDKDKTTAKVSTKGSTTINLLGAVSTKDRELVYGLQITKQVLGPINAGLWGLSNGTIGISIGAQF